MLFHPMSPLHGMSRNASLRSQDCILSPHTQLCAVYYKRGAQGLPQFVELPTLVC